MFCPQCGSSQTEELKFCKLCGANLSAVRQVVNTQNPETFDWSKTWVADMFMSEAERNRRKKALEAQLGITPDVKRANEIKAGVITGCVGIALMIFLYVLMQGIIRSGQNPPSDNEILSVIWVAGVIPLFIGLGLIINGTFISKRFNSQSSSPVTSQSDPNVAEIPGRNTLPSLTEGAISTPVNSPGFSVTEDATVRLREKIKL